jgi:hypothetical protein
MSTSLSLSCSWRLLLLQQRLCNEIEVVVMISLGEGCWMPVVVFLLVSFRPDALVPQ